MLFASVFKVYVGFSSKRFTSDLHDAYAEGLIDSRPHFNSVSKYLSNPELTETLKGLVTTSSLPLKAVESDFAVDSSGFSTSRFVRWQAAMCGGSSTSTRRGMYRITFLGIDAADTR